jgi:hypothetical protein
MRAVGRVIRPALATLDARLAEIERRTELAQTTTSALLEQLVARLEQTSAALEAHAAESRTATDVVETRMAQRIAEVSVQIADVSSRLERLHGLIDAYAEAAVESASQSDHELRRLADVVNALELRLDEAAADQPAE